MEYVSEDYFKKKPYHDDTHGYIEVILTDVTGKERHDYFPNFSGSYHSWDPLQQLSFIGDCHLLDVKADPTKPITIRYVPPTPK